MVLENPEVPLDTNPLERSTSPIVRYDGARDRRLNVAGTTQGFWRRCAIVADDRRSAASRAAGSGRSCTSCLSGHRRPAASVVLIRRGARP